MVGSRLLALWFKGNEPKDRSDDGCLGTPNPSKIHIGKLDAA